MKVDLHSNLLKLMETGGVIFDNDMNILRSLKSMKHRYTKRGDLTIFGRDSHIAEAMVRAAFPLLQNKRWESEPWLETISVSSHNIDPWE